MITRTCPTCGKHFRAETQRRVDAHFAKHVCESAAPKQPPPTAPANAEKQKASSPPNPPPTPPAETPTDALAKALASLAVGVNQLASGMATLQQSQTQMQQKQVELDTKVSWVVTQVSQAQQPPDATPAQNGAKESASLPEPNDWTAKLQRLAPLLALLQGPQQGQGGMGSLLTAMGQFTEFNKAFQEMARSIAEPMRDSYSIGLRDAGDMFSKVYRSEGDPKVAAEYVRDHVAERAITGPKVVKVEPTPAQDAVPQTPAA